jgi:hypothetical protein
VILNGREVNSLEHLLGGAATQSPRLVMSLPPGLLRPGENVLEIRQVPAPEGGRRGSCVFSGLWLEMVQ